MTIKYGKYYANILDVFISYDQWIKLSTFYYFYLLKDPLNKLELFFGDTWRTGRKLLRFPIIIKSRVSRPDKGYEVKTLKHTIQYKFIVIVFVY